MATTAVAAASTRQQPQPLRHNPASHGGGAVISTSRHNPRRRNTHGSSSNKANATRKVVRRREFPQDMEPLRQKPIKSQQQHQSSTTTVANAAHSTQQEASQTAATTIATGNKSHSRFKAVTESRTVAAWKLHSVTWTLTVDTPGGHAPWIAIVRGVELLDDDSCSSSLSDPLAADVSDSLHHYYDLSKDAQAGGKSCTAKSGTSKNVKVPCTTGTTLRSKGNGPLSLPNNNKPSVSEMQATKLLGQFHTSTASMDVGDVTSASAALSPQRQPPEQYQYYDDNSNNNNNDSNDTDNNILPPKTPSRRAKNTTTKQLLSLVATPSAHQNKLAVYEDATTPRMTNTASATAATTTTKVSGRRPSNGTNYNQYHLNDRESEEEEKMEYFEEDDEDDEDDDGPRPPEYLAKYTTAANHGLYTRRHNEQDDDDDDDEETLDEDDDIEDDDYYDDSGSLPSCHNNNSRMGSYFDPPPPSPMTSNRALDDASELASMGDESHEIRMQELLDVLSVGHSLEEDDDLLEENSDIHEEEISTTTEEEIGGEMGDIVEEEENDDVEKIDSLTNHTGVRSNPSIAPPRRPVRTVSHKFQKPQDRQVILLARGVQPAPSGLSQTSGHSGFTDGDDTLENSQILPLSNLDEQPWAGDDDDEDEDSEFFSTSSSDDDDDYSEEDNESVEIRKYVEEMEMAQVDRKEIVAVPESEDEESIMEYYQRDRVTTMLLALNARGGKGKKDDDESTLDHLALEASRKYPQQSSCQGYGLYGGTKGGFDVDLDPNDSANDESLTFLDSNDDEDPVLEIQSISSASISIPNVGTAADIPMTVSAKEALLSNKMNQSLPSIGEDLLWNENKIADEASLIDNQEKWLVAVQDIARKYKMSSAQNGKPKIPKRTVSMDSAQQRLGGTKGSAAAQTARKSAPSSPGKKSSLNNTVNRATQSKVQNAQLKTPVSPNRNTVKKKVVRTGKPKQAATTTGQSKPKKLVRRPANARPKSTICKSPKVVKSSKVSDKMTRMPQPPNTPLDTLKSPASRLRAPSLASIDLSCTSEFLQDRTPPAFAQLDLSGRDGVRMVKTASLLEAEMPDLDDFREQEIIERIERSKARERAKKGRLFGGRGKEPPNKSPKKPISSGNSNFLDNLWSFGTGSSDMAKNMSDMTAYE